MELETALDAEWEQDLETFEIEDPVRTYLREIGRVSLLKKSDERILARRIEAHKHVLVIESKLPALCQNEPTSIGFAPASPLSVMPVSSPFECGQTRLSGDVGASLSGGLEGG